MREIPHDPAADDEDAALMRRLQRGDAAALDELVRRHQGRLVNFFRRLGFTKVKNLMDGIDARAAEVDSSMSRY